MLFFSSNRYYCAPFRHQAHSSQIRLNSAFKRSCAQAVIAILFTIATVIVGIFSSYIASTTNLQVLVKNPRCGPLDIDPTGSNFLNNLRGIVPYRQNIRTHSQPFAEECYLNTIPKSLPTRCTAFIRPNIPLSAERIKCPFDARICAAEDYGVSVDSGLVDGNYIFGWNLNRQDRVKYRRKVTCGVLQDDGHTEIINASDIYDFSDGFGRIALPGEQIELKRYGNTVNGLWGNATFVYSLTDRNLSTLYTYG